MDVDVNLCGEYADGDRHGLLWIVRISVSSLLNYELQGLFKPTSQPSLPVSPP